MGIQYQLNKGKNRVEMNSIYLSFFNMLKVVNWITYGVLWMKKGEKSKCCIKNNIISNYYQESKYFNYYNNLEEI